MSKKPAKVVLINPPSSSVENDRVEPPLGLLYIASSLKESGFEDISVFDMTGCHSELDISNKINAISDADVYGISCFCTNYEYVKRIIDHIKNSNPLSFVVLGGPHPSGMPEYTYKDSHADLVVVGEGEDAFVEAVVVYDTTGIVLKGIIYGKGRANIDSYAFPARQLIDFTTYSRQLMGHPAVSLLSSRGCVYHCVHCNSVVMGGGNRNPRYRTADNLIKEIKLLKDDFSFFRFNDDHFSGNPNLEETLLKLKDLDIKFRIFARLEDLDAKTCKLLKVAGCVHVSVGLESLSSDNLISIGKKRQVGKEDNIKIAKAHGLTVRASFMVGLPYDNDQTVYNSFQRAAQLGLDEFAVYPLIPYPGTQIWKHPEKFGYTILNSDFTDYIQMGRGGKTCYSLGHKNFTPDDVMKWKQIATDLLQHGGVKHMSESDVAK